MSKEKEEESPDYVISGEPWNSDGMTVCWNLSLRAKRSNLLRSYREIVTLLRSSQGWGWEGVLPKYDNKVLAHRCEGIRLNLRSL